MSKKVDRVLRILFVIALLALISLLAVEHPMLSLFFLMLIILAFVAFNFPYRFIAWVYLKITKANYVAITNPFAGDYLVVRKEGYKECVSVKILQHETDHILYFTNKGAVLGSLIYLWYLIWYGYHDNPIEVRARKVAGQDE